MPSLLSLATLIAAVSAARPFLNEPDTGLESYLGADFPSGKLPDLADIHGIPDFDFAARNYLNASTYSFYRTGAAGEWSYRNNLEAFSRVRWRPQVLEDVAGVAKTLPTKILGHQFSAPFFIAPATRAGLAHDAAESNLVKGAYAGDILYVPANGSQILFQQLYASSNITAVQDNLDRAKAAGSKAIVFTIDAPATSTRHRAARFSTTNANADTATLTWALYAQLRNMTSLPIILKGITTIHDVRKAISHGAPAIYVSNHGGRQLDGSPSPLEICLEIYEQDPSLFQKIEIYADSGVRYGTDVLKLLALGVRAVGLGRPFMYANAYGVDGVMQLIELLKTEIAADAANAGIANVQMISRERVNWKPLTSNGF